MDVCIILEHILYEVMSNDDRLVSIDSVNIVLVYVFIIWYSGDVCNVDSAVEPDFILCTFM